MLGNVIVRLVLDVMCPVELYAIYGTVKLPPKLGDALAVGPAFPAVIELAWLIVVPDIDIPDPAAYVVFVSGGTTQEPSHLKYLVDDPADGAGTSPVDPAALLDEPSNVE